MKIKYLYFTLAFLSTLSLSACGSSESNIHAPLENKQSVQEEKGTQNEGIKSQKEQVQISSSDKIHNYIEQLSLEKKVGQLFFVRCPKDHQIKDVNTYHLGGYILFDKDFNGNTFQQVVNNITTYQNNAKIPLLIGVDEEGGSVVRVSHYPQFRAVPFWSPQDLYKEGGMPLIVSDTKEKAELLKRIGINVNLAPISDISTNSGDFINSRSFGKDAEETANYVSTIVSTMKEKMIGSTLKHFPGYGNNVDTHTGISIDNRSYDSFLKSDFLPFKAGIEAGADSVLVSHNIINCMDKEHPASLSKNVHDILRSELNFTGVIMSDDLAMNAISNYTDDDSAAITAIKAGNDLLICTNYREQIPAVIKAVKSGDISITQIDASIYRILNWKQNIGILNI